VLLSIFAECLKSQPRGLPFQVVYQSDMDVESVFSTAEPLVAEQAEIVEDGAMAAHPVRCAENSRFTHFLDGAQKTRLIGYFDYNLPVLYAFLGAVVRRRGDDRRMYTAYQESCENLYIPQEAPVNPDLLKSIGKSIKYVESQNDGNTHPLKLLNDARQDAGHDRDKLERKLAKKWIADAKPDEWLLLDGQVNIETEHTRIVGVIKSHQTQYFDTEDQRKILMLGVGERSSIFKTRGRDRAPVYSWYLRLHSNAGKDIYFGLVRIEAAATKETVSMADEISGWLMRERAPLSLPDSRWDRMIYPIRDCEQYIRSISPSNAMIEGALAYIQNR